MTNENPAAPIDILTLLKKGEMSLAQGRLRWSSNHTFLVEICMGETRTKAIYKPRRGERPLWDFPDGTLCNREVAAYLVSEAIGWQIVPPTVMREGFYGAGSVQLFVEHDPEITYFNLGDYFIPQIQRFAAFDVIVNNADRKGGHCLLDKNLKIWGIDHGICFHTAPKLRTVIWDFAGQPLPDDLKARIQQFQQTICDSKNELMQQLASLLSPQEANALMNRTQRLLHLSKFPQPGNGPSYPWPPV
ncbi:MAG: SCO1664 family protein [Anaerolineae bacterium]|nr:SCO1664 family protein [Anaerolineae bacterium]